MSALTNKIYRLQLAVSKVKCFCAFSTGSTERELESKRAYEIFSNVTKTYEEMGMLAAFGQTNYWKDELAKLAVPIVEGAHILDAAGGQGAISKRILKLVKNAHVEKDFRVTVCDLNPAMMNYGKLLVAAEKHEPNLIDWVEGSVENLPFDNETFNVYIISMGLRSIDINKTFAEAYRVLKPGSRFYCLDVSPIDNPLIARVHRILFYNVVPYVGYKIWKTREPFSYYRKVYEDMPIKEKLKEMIERAGFSQVTYRKLSLGLGAIHFGYKL